MGEPSQAGQTPSNGWGLVDEYKAAAEVGRLSVVDQVAELDAIRNRSATFLAFVGSSTAFLVGTAIRGSAGDPQAGFVVIALFACAAMLAQLVMFFTVMLGLTSWRSFWARQPRIAGSRSSAQGDPPARGKYMEWDSRQSGKMFADWLSSDLADRNPDARVKFYRHLANQYEKQFESNREYLRVTRRRYTNFMIGGFVSLLLWAVAAWLYGTG